MEAELQTSQNENSKDGLPDTDYTFKLNIKSFEENNSRRSSRSSVNSIYHDVNTTLTNTQTVSSSREESIEKNHTFYETNVLKHKDSAAVEYEDQEELLSDNSVADLQAYQSQVEEEEEERGEEENSASVTNIIQQVLPNDNGMFYEATNMDTSDVLRVIADDKLLELEEAFELFDLNRDGLITHGDLKNTFISLGSSKTDEEITRMLSEAPRPLDFEGFVKFIGQKTMQMDPEYILHEALSKWDYDHSGLISLVRIRHDLMSLGDRFTETEVECAFEEANTVVKKGRTMIEYQEFCKILCGMRKPEK